MIKIVVDSGCDLPRELRARQDVPLEVAPLTLQLGDKIYTDDDGLDVSAFVDEMDKCPDTPKTAAPSPMQFLDMFKGEESVFAVTLSSKLSGSYNSAMTAKQIYVEEIGKKFIHVFDSLSASVGEMLVAMKIMEFMKAKKSNAEIIDDVNNFIKNMKTYFILEKYDTLVKSGRLNPYVAKIADLMNFKPICHGVDGFPALRDKARGNSKTFARLIAAMQKDGGDFENRVLGIAHVKALEKATALRDAVLKTIKFKDVIIVDASGLVATYAGREGLVIAF